MNKMLSLAAGHPAAAAVCAAGVLAAAFMIWRVLRRITLAARGALRGQQAEDLLTVVAAGMATAVAMTGMWRFFGTVLHFTGAERVAMFAFLELAVVTCAFRARRNMRSFGSAGAEGLAVWVLSGLSALFSALDARSGAEAVFRLAPPLVASWLWHRAMSLEHRRSAGRTVHWKLTLERVLVWLRLAEPSARTAGEVDAHRRIARLARAAKRLRDRRAAGAASWRTKRARRGLDKAMEGAVEHAALAADQDRQDQLRDQIGALNAAESLASLPAAAPWDRRPAEAAALAGIRREAEDQVRAAAQDHDQVIAEIRRQAEDQVRAAAAETARARQDAARITEAITGQIRALEQSGADLRARADTTDRELSIARAKAAELSEALARPEPNADAAPPEADREALVAELAAGIRAAARAGDRWRPDYDALMARTGRQRRWCEYLVSDARSAVFAMPASQPARADFRADELTHVNGSSR